MLTATLDVRVEDLGDRMVVALAGDIDVTTIARVREALHVVYTRPPRLLVVDLSAVTSSDGALLASLVAARRVGVSRGCTLELWNPSPEVTDALSRAGLGRMIRSDPPH